MANNICRSNYQSKVFYVLGVFSFMLLIQKGYAREFTVNWGLHNGSSAENYNEWAERNRFKIGDSLVFVYQPNNDSVLHVTEDSYKNCTTESPLSDYKDGHTVFSLNHSGAFYFISGNRDNCQNNQKLVVVVLAGRGNSTSPGTNETYPPSPPPQASMDITPTPAPAPSAESPPAVTNETNPTPAPSEEANKPNAASAVLISVTGSIGAFVASTLLLVF